MNGFFLQLWDEIQDFRLSEGCGWKIAVSLYLERLCMLESTFASSDIEFEESSAGEIFNEDETGKWSGTGSSPDAF